ncbi:hypothetical protein PQX77_003427 [Marasmius sp. AFHP31]|nr:hypothetical protein PQX77_003427 [Marasmius sp. AFHP31]
MAHAHSRLSQHDPPAQPRRSVRIALIKLADLFPRASADAFQSDATLHSLTTFLEDVAWLRHAQPHAELHNTDPDLDPVLRQVESELEQEGPESQEQGEGEGGEGAAGCKRRRAEDSRSSEMGQPDAKRAKVERSSKRARKRQRQKANKRAKTLQKAANVPPDVTWRTHRGEELEPGELIRFDFKAVPKSIHGEVRTKARNAIRTAQRFEAKLSKDVACPVAGFQDVGKDSRIATTGWQGRNASVDERQRIRETIRNGQKFEGITPMPYCNKRLFITDGSGRTIIFRSKVTFYMTNHLLPRVEVAVHEFMAKVRWPSEADMKKNLRGEHFFCIAGHDRNNKEKPALSQWHLMNKAILEAFFAKGQPLEELTDYGCNLVRNVFPPIAARFKRCGEEMERKFGIKPLYGGLFFNFCLNGVRMGGPNPVPRVFCEPHIDFKNLALAICMIFVYGHFNHREKCWIVIWEAGVALELPMGVFVLYPSSLFLHFNVDVSNLNFVVTDGSKPTRDNSKPLNCLCRNPRADHGKDWQNAHGRGSMVWFNQASMFQTTELGYNTVAQAAAADAKTTCDAEEWLAKGIFPALSLDD